MLFATLALLPPMLQGLMGYPALQAGLVTAPRGVGTLVAMLIVGRLMGRIDARLIIGTGFALTALSLWQMTQFTSRWTCGRLIGSGVHPGPGHRLRLRAAGRARLRDLAPALRNEGTAIFSLLRNIGSSVGIAVVQALLVRNTQIAHATLAEHLTAFKIAGAQVAGVAPAHTLAALDAGVTGQALMIAYLDDFQLMFLLTCLSIPLLLLVRSPRRQADAPHVAVE